MSGAIPALPALFPVDLEIRVTTQEDGDALLLDYVLHSDNGRLDLFNVPFPGGRLRRSAAWQERIFKTLEKLRRGLDLHGVPLTEEDVATDLAALGEDLYDELFPPELRRIWWQDICQAETILLVSDEPWIPWEIVKPYGENGSESRDDDFLASRFQLTRWPGGGRTPPTLVEVVQLAVIEAGSPPDLKPLAKSAAELRFLQEVAARHGIKVQSLIDTTHARVLALLGEHDFGLLHLVGHGEHDTLDAETSGFYLHDGRMLRPRDLRHAVRERLRKNRPLVFLNVCHAGRQSWSLTRIGGWSRRFLEAGCSAFVAPQWTVDDDGAHTFAMAFYEALEGGKTFGEAALAARCAFPKGSLGRLAYAVYAHPNGRLVFTTLEIPDLNSGVNSRTAARLIEVAYKPGTASRILGLIEEAIERLGDPTERYWLYIAAGEIGGDKARSIIEKGLEDDNEFAKLGATTALRMLERGS